jgi:hypothetical protein
MRVFPAGAGPGFVDGAVVVGAKEGTGCYVQDVISFFVQVQVLFDKLAWFDTEVAT